MTTTTVIYGGDNNERQTYNNLLQETDRYRNRQTGERQRESGRRIDEKHHRLRHRLTQTHIGQAGRQIQALRQKRQAGRV